MTGHEAAAFMPYPPVGTGHGSQAGEGLGRSERDLLTGRAEAYPPDAAAAAHRTEVYGVTLVPGRGFLAPEGELLKRVKTVSGILYADVVNRALGEEARCRVLVNDGQTVVLKGESGVEPITVFGHHVVKGRL